MGFRRPWLWCNPFASILRHRGKQLAIQLNALNAQLWKLHEQLALPVEFPNKLIRWPAKMARGGSESDPSWALCDHDLQTLPPAALGLFKPSHGWPLGQEKP